ELPVVLEVLLPDEVAVEVVAGEPAGPLAADVGPDVLAVGAARGGGVAGPVRPVAVLAGAGHRLTPLLLAVGADTQQDDLAAGRRREENAVAPDAGGGLALAGELELPDDVLGRRPLGREAGLGAVAVVLRAAPLRPVLGDGKRGDG